MKRMSLIVAFCIAGSAYATPLAVQKRQARAAIADIDTLYRLANQLAGDENQKSYQAGVLLGRQVVENRWDKPLYAMDAKFQPCLDSWELVRAFLYPLDRYVYAPNGPEYKPELLRIRTAYVQAHSKCVNLTR